MKNAGNATYLTAFADMEQQKANMIAGLCDDITALSDNQNISRVNKNCFTISSAEIFSTKRMSLSAYAYDFKYQYATVAETLKKAQNINNALDTLLSTKQISVDGKMFTLDDLVVENIKQILQKKWEK